MVIGIHESRRVEILRYDAVVGRCRCCGCCRGFHGRFRRFCRCDDGGGGGVGLLEDVSGFHACPRSRIGRGSPNGQRPRLRRRGRRRIHSVAWIGRDRVRWLRQKLRLMLQLLMMKRALLLLMSGIECHRERPLRALLQSHVMDVE